MYEYEHKSIKKYRARVCINIDKTLYKIQKWDFYKYNHIYTNTTTFIYRNIFLHFNINSNLGKTQGQLEAKQYDGRCVGVEKNIKHQLHQKNTSNKDKHKRNADYICTWFVEKTKKCKKLDKSQHCGGVGAMPPLGGSGLPTICD